MALPTLTKTWIISPNNRLTAGSLAGMTGAVLYATKEFLKAHGYTIKGTSDGVSAAMDGVDRWTDASKASIRNVSITGAMSWVCITNGDGVDVVLAFWANTDTSF